MSGWVASHTHHKELAKLFPDVPDQVHGIAEPILRGHPVLMAIWWVWGGRIYYSAMNAVNSLCSSRQLLNLQAFAVWCTRQVKSKTKLLGKHFQHKAPFTQKREDYQKQLLIWFEEGLSERLVFVCFAMSSSHTHHSNYHSYLEKLFW